MRKKSEVKTSEQGKVIEARATGTQDIQRKEGSGKRVKILEGLI
jgi:hypothetical protein